MGKFKKPVFDEVSRWGTVMQKTYVLDTNVLIQSPEALEAFEDNHIVLPLAVLEELDGLKNAEGEKGRSARQVIRFLEELRSQGSLVEGVSLPGGGTLRLEVNHQKFGQIILINLG